MFFELTQTLGCGDRVLKGTTRIECPGRMSRSVALKPGETKTLAIPNDMVLLWVSVEAGTVEGPHGDIVPGRPFIWHRDLGVEPPNELTLKNTADVSASFGGVTVEVEIGFEPEFMES